MTAPTMPPLGGPSAHGQPPAQLPAARPPRRGMAWAVAIASTFVGLGYVADAATSHLLQAPLLEAEREQDFDRLTGIYGALALVAGLTFVAWVAAFVLTGLWFLQLRRFAERVNPHYQHGRRRWWAFGSWIVPFVNLWFPLQYAGDLRDSLRPHENKSSLFGWWWVALLVSTAVDRWRPVDEEGLDLMAGVATLSAGAALVALALWLGVVRNLATAVSAVPEDVVRRTAFVADPEPYAPTGVAPGTPLYGPPQG